MIKFLLVLVILFAAMAFISSEPWFITIQMFNYEVRFSFALALFFLFILWIVWSIIKKPFSWLKNFHSWLQRKQQQNKENFLFQLLNALANTNYETYPTVLSNAKKLYGEKSQNYMLLKSILTPNQQLFDQMTKDPSTFLAGTRGLVREALAQGDITEATRLLGTVPEKQQSMSWVQQAKWDIALLQNDWATALKILDIRKKSYDKAIYLAYRACLLLQLGYVKEAYELAPTHPAIAVAYAKAYPKKAEKALMQAWNVHPTWDIYSAYVQALASLPPEKRMKAVLRLIHKNPRSRWALMACADMAIQTKQWQRAKENLEVYLQTYPLTKKVALMMAQVEREGYHHSDAATDWETRATEAEDITRWICDACNHRMESWEALCPHCNALNTIQPLG
ncbi:MAG: hypothetical protein J6Y85_02985 [Alphaproteobacteria bacterium]|nr:hypothetical protein [Alphaproteobacteria bacterium]